METRTTPEGETVFVADDEAERGSTGPFYVVYRDADRTERFGFLCAPCGTLNNAMDTMGRIVCNECGNTHQAEEWDAAHE